MQLKPMSENEFEIYFNQVCQGYAQEQVKAGSWPAEQALNMATAEIKELLPEGMATPNQLLYSLVVPGEPSPVGILWIHLRKRNLQMEAFIDDILIHEAYRRKGYASQALSLLEQTVKEMGVDKIRLHVFGHNHEAITLYKKCGYETINIYMERQIPTETNI